MVVTLGQSGGMETGTPRRLFATGIDPSPSLGQYTVKPDGRRFLVLDRGERRADSLQVLLNWLGAANQSAP